jgi:TRAP-type uncharacterized transport system substrate-binding protein
MKKSVLIGMLLSMVVSFAHASKVDGAPSAACDGLRIATGPAGKGYSKLYSDLVRVAKNDVALCEVNTEGGLDNLTTLSIKKADVGIVPLDALKQMSQGDENIANLQVVATLNSNFLHVVVSAGGYTFDGPKKYGFMKGDSKTVRITKLSDLRGAPVALVGSAQLMVRQLDKLLGYGMQYIDVPTDDAAFKMVQAGQAFAAFTVSGWPSGPIGRLNQASGLTLVPFDVSINGPYSVRRLSYKNIGVYDVPSLSVPNLVVTRPFSGSKINEVAALKQVMVKNLSDLKDGDYEPAWNEIKTLDAPIDWQKFKGGAAAPAPAPAKAKR